MTPPPPAEAPPPLPTELIAEEDPVKLRLQLRTLLEAGLENGSLNQALDKILPKVDAADAAVRLATEPVVVALAVPAEPEEAEAPALDATLAAQSPAPLLEEPISAEAGAGAEAAVEISQVTMGNGATASQSSMLSDGQPAAEIQQLFEVITGMKKENGEIRDKVELLASQMSQLKLKNDELVTKVRERGSS